MCTYLVSDYLSLDDEGREDNPQEWGLVKTNDETLSDGSSMPYDEPTI